MKNVSKLAVMLSLGLAAGFATTTAFAAVRAGGTDPEAYVKSYRDHSTAVPAPLKVVVPDALLVSSEDSGSVDVAFIVDATGTPTNITVAYASDEVLVEPVVKAVARWRFTPALRDGVPVATKMLLPVRFTVAANN